uniref:Glycosyl hydrolases family 22 (GH22) domain-containing protein n=1 Tax=Felis catus TaxID=9685 RepID=A0ABI7XGW6_FELCA
MWLRVCSVGILPALSFPKLGWDHSIIITCIKNSPLRAGLEGKTYIYWHFWLFPPLGICMAYYESHYNTTAQTQLEDGSTDYGIFQINSFTWCRHAKLQEKNHCHVACSALLTDDLTDAIICAKKIAKETEGMNYWQGWKKHCEGKDLSEWKKGCEVS